MNPFYYIDELKQTLETKKNEVANSSARISAEQHYLEMINMLTLLEIEMKEAEYNYEIQSLDFKVKTFEELLVLQKQLNEDVIIFQPVANADLTALDMQSLADVLKKLRDSGQIKENILLLPPDINVFRAVLSKNSHEDYDE